MPRRKRLSVTPDGHVEIGDPSTLKAIADPLRLELVTLLAEPKTAKEAAATLQVPTTRLYYHLRVLEEHGLIKVVRTRKVSGIEEKTYRSVGVSWSPSPDLTLGSIESSGLLGSVVDLVRAELSVALRDSPGGAVGDPDSAAPVLLLNRLAFDREGLVEFQKRLYELLLEYATSGPSAPTGKTLYHLFVAGYLPPAVGRALGKGQPGKKGQTARRGQGPKKGQVLTKEGRPGASGS